MAVNYVLLQEVTLTTAVSTFTMNSIPQSGYTDLKLYVSARLDNTGSWYDYFVSFNGVTTGYSNKFLYGTNAGLTYLSESSAGVCVRTSTNANTANTFGTAEFLIPDYRSSNPKKISYEGTSVNTTSQTITGISDGTWNNSAAITSITFTTLSGNFVPGTTVSIYGIAEVGTTPTVFPKATGGDIIRNDGTYWIHTFLSTGAFVPSQPLTCDYLVVAGGGGTGGGYESGGAGGGGLRSTVTATGGGGALESPVSVLANTVYPVTVGAGGAGGPTDNPGYQGNNSSFAGITSIGGGAGGAYSTWSVRNGNGGSGGGSGRYFSPGTGTAGQGYNGGYNPGGANTDYATGGGGGAGSVGYNASGGPNYGGAGGAGQTVAISGSSVTYAGGGGGTGNSTSGAGGSGGGGAGGYTGGSPGAINTGGGAGGIRQQTSLGQTGGSGIVIIRYPMA